MGKRRKPQGRKRIGRVSYYCHHGAWWIYYLDRNNNNESVRRYAARSEGEAAIIAAQVNAQLAASAPTLFSYTPITIAELQRRFIEYHEQIQRSSLATVRRYRTATQHLVNFSQQNGGNGVAHTLNAECFVRYLRTLRVAPNGHPNAKKRSLRDKGVRFILETCRSMYGYAAKKRFMPPYAENPFAGLGGKRFHIEDARRILIFDPVGEAAFFRAADDWSFPIHFLLAKTGLRPSEATHLLKEELDLANGWLEVRNKSELGWRFKTRRERCVPLIPKVVLVLRRVIGERTAGPVFIREKFDLSCGPLSNLPSVKLVTKAEQRVAATEHKSDVVLSRL